MIFGFWGCGSWEKVTILFPAFDIFTFPSNFPFLPNVRDCLVFTKTHFPFLLMHISASKPLGGAKQLSMSKHVDKVIYNIQRTLMQSSTNSFCSFFCHLVVKKAVRKLIKYVQDLYEETYKTQMNEMKGEENKWRVNPC